MILLGQQLQRTHCIKQPAGGEGGLKLEKKLMERLAKNLEKSKLQYTPGHPSWPGQLGDHLA
jgi:hypothetical protein